MAAQPFTSDSRASKALCTCAGCERKSNSRGWCKPHYDAFLRTGDPTSYRGDRSHLSDWEKVQEIGWTRSAAGCLEYNGFRNQLGYGLFRGSKKSGLVRVHRLAYENLVGPLLPDEEVLHRCDNPSCSEPSHLFKGTQSENVKDMRSKRRGYKDDWTRCPNGHAYPADRPARLYRDRCRDCANERNRRYYARKMLRCHGDQPNP